MQAPLIIFLMGPTACGKTTVALELCANFNAEIISVDSALVYKGMDIGTAKPSRAQQAHIPHHLIDLCDPTHSYNVSEFCQDAQQAITDIISRGKTPLLVGGTMMYFNALKTGLSQLPSRDPHIRKQIAAQAEQEGWPALHQQLSRQDPESARLIHIHDAQRISRALEIFALTGRSLHTQASTQQACAYSICSIALMPAERNILHKQIEQRFDEMLSQGFMEEVAALFQRGDLSLDLPAMRAVGYRQAWHYLAGEGDFTHMRATTLAATRQLAKHQVTWLRKWEDLSWFAPIPTASVYAYLKKIIEVNC